MTESTIYQIYVGDKDGVEHFKHFVEKNGKNVDPDYNMGQGYNEYIDRHKIKMCPKICKRNKSPNLVCLGRCVESWDRLKFDKNNKCEY